MSPESRGNLISGAHGALILRDLLPVRFDGSRLAERENTHSRLALTKGRQNLAIFRFCRFFHTTALDESDSEFPPIYRKHEVSLVHIGRRLPFSSLKAISLGCANRWRWDSWHI